MFLETGQAMNWERHKVVMVIILAVLVLLSVLVTIIVRVFGAPG